MFFGTGSSTMKTFKVVCMRCFQTSGEARAPVSKPAALATRMEKSECRSQYIVYIYVVYGHKHVLLIHHARKQTERWRREVSYLVATG